MKQFSLLLVGSLVVACGPKLKTDRVMTPEERLQEQERLAYEAELEAQNNPQDSELDLEEEDEVKSFDEGQAEMELRRATLSAVTCPDVVEKAPKGTGEIAVTWSHDGTVRDASINSPFAGSPIEDCVLNAYKAVIVPPFKESEYTMNWKVDLSGKKKDLMPKEDSDSTKAFAGDGEEEEGKEGKEGDKKGKDKDKGKKK